LWSEIQTAAVEVDGVNKILFIAEAAGGVLDPLDFGIDGFAAGIGDPVSQVRDDVFEPPLQHPCYFDHWHPRHFRIPPTGGADPLRSRNALIYFHH
jgi:hypothetical protein